MSRYAYRQGNVNTSALVIARCIYRMLFLKDLSPKFDVLKL